MPILKDVELWFPKLVPEKPSKKFNPDNPTWEVQLRTTDKAVKRQWEEMGLSVKPVVPDEGAPYFRVNLKKRSIKADGTNADPPEVINGAMQPVDPETIGNGSIANVRIFQYTSRNKATNKEGVATVLMGVQLTKHIIFVLKDHDDGFEVTDTEVISPTTKDDDDIPF